MKPSPGSASVPVWVTQGRTEHHAFMFVGSTKMMHEDGTEALDENAPGLVPYVLIKWSSTNDTAYVPESTMRLENDGATRRRRRPAKPIYTLDSPPPKKESKKEQQQQQQRPKKEVQRSKKKETAKHKPPPPQAKKSRKRGAPPPLRLNATVTTPTTMAASRPEVTTPTFPTLAAATTQQGTPAATVTAAPSLAPVAEEEPPAAKAPVPAVSVDTSKEHHDDNYQKIEADIPVEDNPDNFPTLQPIKPNTVLSPTFFDRENDGGHSTTDEEEWMDDDSPETTTAGKKRPRPTNGGAKTEKTAATAANSEPHLQSEDSDEEHGWQDPDATTTAKATETKSADDQAVVEKPPPSGETSTPATPSAASSQTPLSTPVPLPASPFHPKLTMEHYDVSDRDTFPGQLFRLLRDAKELGIDHILSWEDDDKTFRMNNEKKFLKILHRLSNCRKVISFRNTLSQFSFQCVEYGEKGRAYRHVSAIPTHHAADDSSAKENNGSILFHKDATEEQLQQVKRRRSGHRKKTTFTSASKTNTPPKPLSIDTKTLKRLSIRSSPPKKLDADEFGLSAPLSINAEDEKLSSNRATTTTNSNGLVKKRKLSPSDLEMATTSMPINGKRRRIDGWVMPSEGSTQLLEDGTWVKPDGEPPAADLKWDAGRGMWAPLSFSNHNSGSESEATERSTKRVDEDRLPLKKKKNLVLYTSDDDDDEEDDSYDEKGNKSAEESMSEKPKKKMSRKAERETRRTSDGCLIPRHRVQNEDGTYAKPCGPPPRNLSWDPIRGIWAPSKSAKTRSQPPTRTQPPRASPESVPAIVASVIDPTGRRTLPPRASRDAAAAAISKPTQHRPAPRPARDPLDRPPTRVQYVVPQREQTTVVSVEASGKHHVLRSSPMFPTFLMFKKRHVFRGKFKARTKANPTGIVGGDNQFMKDVNKDNWSKIQRMMQQRREAAATGGTDDSMDVEEEHAENLSHNTNASFSSGESTLVAQPPSLETEVVEYAVPSVLPSPGAVAAALPSGEHQLTI